MIIVTIRNRIKTIFSDFLRKSANLEANTNASRTECISKDINDLIQKLRQDDTNQPVGDTRNQEIIYATKKHIRNLFRNELETMVNTRSAAQSRLANAKKNTIEVTVNVGQNATSSRQSKNIKNNGKENRVTRYGKSRASVRTSARLLAKSPPAKQMAVIEVDANQNTINRHILCDANMMKVTKTPKRKITFEADPGDFEHIF